MRQIRGMEARIAEQQKQLAAMRSALGEIRVEDPGQDTDLRNDVNQINNAHGESPDVQLSGLQRPDILGASYTAVGPVE